MPRYCLWDGMTKVDEYNPDIFSIGNRERFNDLRENLYDYWRTEDVEFDNYFRVWETLVALASPATGTFYGNLQELSDITCLKISDVKATLRQLQEEENIFLLSPKNPGLNSPLLKVFDRE